MARCDAGASPVKLRPDVPMVGVVAFEEGGLVVQPPPDDVDALEAAIDRLAPECGTSLGREILTALNFVAPESTLVGARTPQDSLRNTGFFAQKQDEIR